MKSFHKDSESKASYRTLSPDNLVEKLHQNDVTIPGSTAAPTADQGSMDSQTVITILALSSLAVAIAIGIIFIKIWKRCHKSRNENFGSTTVQQSLLGIPGKETADTEDVEMGATASIAYDEIINMASDVCLEPNDPYLTLVATHLNTDFKPLFASLNVSKQVVYQEQKRAATQGEGMGELYLAILNRWVGQYGREAKLSVLYSALHSNGYNTCCRKILEKLQVLNNAQVV